MAKAFSVASWNIEKFGESRRKISSTVEFLAQQKADVVALYEVKSNRRIFPQLVKQMKNYQFFITEGKQSQEILVGIKKTVQAYVTQKLTFKSGQSTLRPGVLVTVIVNDIFYSLLFLHLKSNQSPKGFGLRNDMIKRAYDFRNVLTKSLQLEVKEETGTDMNVRDIPVAPLNYMFLGDLNTMGLNYYPSQQFDISSEDEIAELKRFSQYRDMRLLSKNADATWSNGTGSRFSPTDLDHVVAADHLEFKNFGGANVDVRGWPKLSREEEKDEWIREYSDHALLYFEVQKVPEYDNIT